MTWDPQQYLKFGGERMRPALDLVARIPLDAPREIVDLGCGPGTVTAIVKSRWPDARITGVDNSAAMLERARKALPEVSWQNADLAAWTPATPPELVFSNAALHWLDGHDALFPTLVSKLPEGGVLAVQMPAQHRAPSHLIGYEIAESPRWRDKLKGLVRRRPVMEPEDYYALLAPRVAALDIWVTTYLQPLAGPNAVAEFTKGSFIGVWLTALSAPDAASFEDEYRERIAAAYLQRADGVTLFPFRRLFIVAKR